LAKRAFPLVMITKLLIPIVGTSPMITHSRTDTRRKMNSSFRRRTAAVVERPVSLLLFHLDGLGQSYTGCT
jgi:hypothetical protein